MLLKDEFLRESTDDEAMYELAEKVMTLSTNYIKGSYSGLDPYIGRKPVEALQFAKALKADKKLFAEVKKNYKAVYAILEDENYHAANLGLDALFNQKQFKNTMAMFVDAALGYVK